ncbi:MAG: YchF/TatD family DNA exonuclease [Planctomycetota bacterium]
MLRLYDSHCHIDMEQFDDDREEVISRARAVGVERLNLIASSSSTFEKTSLIVTTTPGASLAVGVSPFESDAWDELAPRLAEYATRPEVVAIGECGLDYYWDIASPAVQGECFASQLRLAAELSKPVIVHCRDAWDDVRFTIDAAKRSFGDRLRGVIHCFTGLPDDAKFFIKRGFYISFAGNLTYKKAENLRETLRSIPIERVLFETDSPYLAPQSNRGKRCEPAFVAETVEFAAKELGVSAAMLAHQAFTNALKLFHGESR